MSTLTISSERTQSSLLSEDGLDLGGLLACGLIIGSFGLILGPWGFLAGIITTIGWVVLGTPAAIAIGHVSMAAMLASVPSTPELLFLESGFIGLVLLPLWSTSAQRRLLVLTVTTIGLLGAILLITWVFWPPFASAITVLLVITGAVYLIHRDAIVRLAEVSTDE